MFFFNFLNNTKKYLFLGDRELNTLHIKKLQTTITDIYDF